jgi:hypothetical protein
MGFMMENSALIDDEVDAKSSDRTKSFKVILGEVLLLIREMNFGTVGNPMVNKGSSEKTGKLTLDEFPLKTKGS